MKTARLAHGGGKRGEGGLGQKALVVSAGTGRGVVVDGDVVGCLAAVDRQVAVAECLMHQARQPAVVCRAQQHLAMPLLALQKPDRPHAAFRWQGTVRE